MSETLRKTPLTAWHAAHGARLVPFAGFEMPVQYADGIQDEVRVVRNACGLFDLCHMGRLVLAGPGRIEAADHVLSQSMAKIPEGAIRYALICRPDGGVIDDVLVYREPEAPPATSLTWSSLATRRPALGRGGPTLPLHGCRSSGSARRGPSLGWSQIDGSRRSPSRVRRRCA
jgi:glycine cleavage system aminomethyltransferase T